MKGESFNTKKGIKEKLPIELEVVPTIVYVLEKRRQTYRILLGLLELGRFNKYLSLEVNGSFILEQKITYMMV